jgi:hypothetical protein
VSHEGVAVDGPSATSPVREHLDSPTMCEVGGVLHSQLHICIRYLVMLQ